MIFGHFNAVAKMALLGSWWHPGTLQIFFSSPCCQWRSRLIKAREDRIICAGDVGTELYFVAVARPKWFLPKKKAGAIWLATTLNSRFSFLEILQSNGVFFAFKNTLPWQRMSFLKSQRTNWWRSEMKVTLISSTCHGLPSTNERWLAPFQPAIPKKSPLCSTGAPPRK